MKTTIEALTEAGLRDAVKIMVSGVPVTAAFAVQTEKGKNEKAA